MRHILCSVQYGSICRSGKLVALQRQLCSLQHAACCIAAGCLQSSSLLLGPPVHHLTTLWVYALRSWCPLWPASQQPYAAYTAICCICSPCAAKCSPPAAKCTPPDVQYQPVCYPVANQTAPYAPFSAICCICNACAGKCSPQAAKYTPQASNISP